MKKTLITYVFFCSIFIVLTICLILVGVKPDQLSEFLFPVALLFTFLLLIFSNKNFLYFLLAIIPFATTIFEYEIGIVTFNLYTLSIIGLATLTIIKSGIRLIEYKRMPIDLSILIIFFLYLFTTLTSETLILSGLLLFHGLFIPIASYFVIINSLKTYEDYYKAYNFFLLGLIILCIFSLIEYLFNTSRITIFSITSISLATFLSVPTLYAFYSWSLSKELRIPIFFICFIAIILTYSRLYFVFLLLSPVIYLIIRKGKAGVLLATMLIFTLFTTLTIALLVSTVQQKNLLSTKAKNDEIRLIEKSIKRLVNINHLKATLTTRALSYKKGIIRFFDNPLIGNGLSLEEGMATTRHNFHIEWLEYGGIIGYLLFTFVFLMYFIKLGELALKNKEVAVNLLTCFGVLCNGLTNGLFHGSMPLVLFIMMGFGKVIYKLVKDDNWKPSGNSKIFN